MKNRKHFQKGISLIIVLLVAICMIFSGFTVFAEESNKPTGKMIISKTVTGENLPSNEIEYEFTLTKDGKAAIGNYSIENNSKPISVDGKIYLKAGESALLTNLEPGDYIVTETSLQESNYDSTEFKVNNENVQTGLSAHVNVKESSLSVESGWNKKNDIIAKDDDGYFVYTITSDQIEADGNITVNCNELAEYMEAQMRDNQNYSTSNFKLKFVNETGVPIHYTDYKFDTVNWIPTGTTYLPSNNPTMLDTNDGANSRSAGYGWGEAWQMLYPMLVGKSISSTTLNATGFDNNKVRIALSPLRCINPAIISYFKSNPGKGTLTGNNSTSSASNITLLQMNEFNNLIKKAFSFKNWEGNEISLPADSNRTYSDFICAFYDVNSLNELSNSQKYNILGSGSKGSPAMPYDGQANIWSYYANTAGQTKNWCIPYTALNDGTLNYFKTWGLTGNRVAAGKYLNSGGQQFTEEDAATYAYQSNYYLLESDPEIVSMAYEYLYNRCMRLSFDTDNYPVSTTIDNSNPQANILSIKNYIDKTDEASNNIRVAMNNGQDMQNKESIKLDRVKGYIEVPNAWSIFRYYDFGFKLTFKADKQPQIASISFTNKYIKKTKPTPIEKGNGNLSVTKIVTGKDGDIKKDFSFSIKLDDQNINGNYGDLSFKNGVANFSLKHNETKSAISLPAGISYKVIENDANKDNYITTSSGESGKIILNKTIVANFINEKKNTEHINPNDKNMYGNLKISKKVTGNNGDTNKAFTFTISIDSSLNGKYGEINFINGKGTFKLKHGESIIATSLPANVTYSITENDNGGYSVTSTREKGTIQKNKTIEVMFTNHKDKTVSQRTQTGDDSNMYKQFLLMICSLISITILIIIKYNYQKHLK